MECLYSWDANISETIWYHTVVLVWKVTGSFDTCIASFPCCSRLQFLIACSMQKNGGGRPRRKSCIRDIRYRREGRREGGQCPMKNLEVLSCSRTWDCNVRKTASIQLVVFSRLEADQRKVCELQWSGTAPLTSTLTSTWRHTRDSFSQAFPLRFCILQAIKNWRREQPENKANTHTHTCMFQAHSFSPCESLSHTCRVPRIRGTEGNRLIVAKPSLPLLELQWNPA